MYLPVVVTIIGVCPCYIIVSPCEGRYYGFTYWTRNARIYHPAITLLTFVNIYAKFMNASPCDGYYYWFLCILSTLLCAKRIYANFHSFYQCITLGISRWGWLLLISVFTYGQKRVKRMNASPCDEYFYWFLCIPSSPWVIYKRFLWLSVGLSEILQQTLPNLSKYSVTF